MNAENCWCWMHSWPLLFNSVVGVPSAEDWPQEVALPQSAFTPRPPKPIENLVPDMDEQGRALLMVGSTGYQSKCITECSFSQITPCLLYIIILQACTNWPIFWFTLLVHLIIFLSSLLHSNSLPSTPPGGYRPLLHWATPIFKV